jgi:dTMP kinase
MKTETQPSKNGISQMMNETLPGKLLVIEGSDYSGHSTQSALLKDWLEVKGYGVFEAGIKRSSLMREAIEEAKEEQILGRMTLGLLYATDFADEFVNGIIPALRAGQIVVADRYIYTLIARQLVRGSDEDWLEKLFSFARKPDLIFYLSVPPEELLHRCLFSFGRLPYWESGMDLAISNDMTDSFLMYQERLLKEYERLSEKYKFITVDGCRSIEDIHKFIRKHVKRLLKME